MIKIASHIRKLTFAPCVSANSKRQNFCRLLYFKKTTSKRSDINALLYKLRKKA